MASLRPRPGIMEISAYVGGKAELPGIARVIKLSANESALGPSPSAIEALHKAAAELHRYPDGDCIALRAALGRRFELDPARILCGAGSDELIQLLARAYAGPGDEVLHTAHGFLIFQIQTLAAGAVPIAAPERGLRADVDALLERVTSRTRIVFIANPNNPTGSYLTAAELARLQAGLPPDVLLVIDGAYAEYVRRPDYSCGLELVDAADNVVMLRTFSKLFGLATLRLGWLYAKPPIIDVLQRIRGPFNVSGSAQAAGIAALADLDHQERSRAHNDLWLPRLTQALAGLGITVHPSIANFLLLEFEPHGPRSAQAALACLERHGVIARPLGAYGLPICLRLSVGSEADNRTAIEALRGFMAGA
jgi:histidinol-phosphate aminotransferase